MTVLFGSTPRTSKEWQRLFRLIQPTDKAGALAFQAVCFVGVSSYLPFNELATDYAAHLILGRPALTKEQLLQCVYDSVSLMLPLDSVLVQHNHVDN